MIKLKKILFIFIIVLILISGIAIAIAERDNGNLKVYSTSGGTEGGWLKGFDIMGYVENAQQQDVLISSTYSNYGYHTFLNVNGINGEMNGDLTSEEGRTIVQKAEAMQYTAVTEDNLQNINGIDIQVSTEFVNNGEQIKMIYTLTNTTASTATISLATTADVQIDGDDSATIERIENNQGIRLWTREGHLKKPVQFVFYGSGLAGVTNVDNIWIGGWGYQYFSNMFKNNPEITEVKDRDSAFTYSWTNRTINAGQTQTYSVLMEVGQVNIPNTLLDLENNTKFYYEDVVINGTIIDSDLVDTSTIHYTIDNGTEYTLEPIAMDGTQKSFEIDLTPLNLAVVTDHTIKVWATDGLENSSNEVERTFTITNLKTPVLTLSETEWTNEDVTFRITDTENNQTYVDKYQYKINDGQWIDTTKDQDHAIEGEGIIQVSIRIVGTVSGDYSNIVTATAHIDKTPPTTTLPTATSTTNSITVTSAQTDALSGINSSQTRYAIKTGDTWGEWQTSNVFNGLIHNTEYKVKTSATDNAGNSSESAEFTIRTTELIAGELILKENSSSGAIYTVNTWINKNIYAEINSNGMGTKTFSSVTGSAQTVNATNSPTVISTNGETRLIVVTTDGTNTVNSDEYIIKVDKTAPVINSITLSNTNWTNSTKTITGIAIDTLSGINNYQFTTDANILATSNGWTSIENTIEAITKEQQISIGGTYYFYVKDLAGNVSSVNVPTNIDVLSPIITFVREDGKTTINVTETGSGIKDVKYYWSTQNTQPETADWLEYTESVTYDGESTGIIYLWALATDNANNSTTQHTTYSEVKAPTIVAENEYTGTNTSFKLTCEDVDADLIYQFTINDGEWQIIDKDTLYEITNSTSKDILISARTLDNAGRYSQIVTKTIKTKVVSSNIDNTQATQNLPKTGKNIIIITTISLTAMIIIGIVKIKKYKEI